MVVGLWFSSQAVVVFDFLRRFFCEALGVRLFLDEDVGIGGLLYLIGLTVIVTHILD